MIPQLSIALILHISAGSLGILSGAAALSVRKGERLHRAFGNVFFVSMLAMSAFATYLSVLRQPGTIVGSIFTFYLVATAWATVKRKEASVGLFEKVALLVGMGCAAGELTLGALAANNPTGQFLGYPAGIYLSSVPSRRSPPPGTSR